MSRSFDLLRRGGDNPVYEEWDLSGDTWTMRAYPHTVIDRNDLDALYSEVSNSQGKADKSIAWDIISHHADPEVLSDFLRRQEEQKNKDLHKKEVQKSYDRWYRSRDLPMQKGCYPGPEVFVSVSDDDVWFLARYIPTGMFGLGTKTEKIELEFVPTVNTVWDEIRDRIEDLLKRR